RLGLTKNEIKLYTTLLGKGAVTSGILVKETGIHVSAVYYALENLIKKGLVAYVLKARRKYFQAEDPKQLSRLLEEKKEALDAILPRLHDMKKASTAPITVLVHEGFKGFKGIYDHILSTLTTGKEYYVFGARQIGDPAHEELNAFLINYHRQREKKGINVNIIFNKDVKEKILTKTRDFKGMHIKFMNTPTNSYVLIYADRVINFLFTERLLAIEIINKEVAQSYKEFFKLMWKSATS
ncbi:MAG: helix-turn-helix domain-containing protein, partial [Nanoarchaeota archaeon]